MLGGNTFGDVKEPLKEGVDPSRGSRQCQQSHVRQTGIKDVLGENTFGGVKEPLKEVVDPS